VTQEEDKVITINIPMSMYKWLQNHKEINRSKLFREAVSFKMKNMEHKMNPLMFLMSVMGIVFSISLVGIAVTPSPIHVYARALMALLGGFLALTTSVVYVKERNRLK